MSTVTKEIMNLARKAGYEGEDKTNVTKAIDALADTLAGENLEQATNVAAAIRKLQPYVGGDGGDGEVTSYTLENFNTIYITIPEDTTLQEDEVEAWIDEQIESWINEQQIETNSTNSNREVSSEPVRFANHSNNIAGLFKILLDKNKNIIDIDVEPEAPAVGGGILPSAESVFTIVTLEKEGIAVPGAYMFDPSSKQSGWYHQLYAIRTERNDYDLLVPLEVVNKFDAEELIEDVATFWHPELGIDFPIPLVNYPSLNSSLSFDDFLAIGLSPNQIAEPRIVLCQVTIDFASQTHPTS